jgi:hypothetical protein
MRNASQRDTGKVPVKQRTRYIWRNGGGTLKAMRARCCFSTPEWEREGVCVGPAAATFFS